MIVAYLAHKPFFFFLSSHSLLLVLSEENRLSGLPAVVTELLDIVSLFLVLMVPFKSDV